MVRPATTNENVEMYLKYVYLLTRDSGDAARTGKLSKALMVSPASVTEMLEKLARSGLVKHEKYQGARLTPKGRRIAMSILQRHCVMEWFLAQKLKVPKGRFHDEACKMEHALSPDTAKRLRVLTNQPDTCPSCYDLSQLHCRYLVAK
ncbi:MAG TPA: metal-dependent transcriptional regulator [Thermoplasmata archaeon]|nr:metal-dependent transcriptional regulator [Thermoplasmata archaeon]